MEEHIEVRRLHHVKGLSMRAIARSTGFHRATVAKILAEDSAQPVYCRRGRARGRPKLGPFVGVIEAQVDWGEARALDENGAERKAHLFVMTLPFSDARFVAAFPRETLEFFLEGHARAFAFFGGVPRRIVSDNLRSAVTKVGRGHRRQLNPAFESFAARICSPPRFATWRRGTRRGTWRTAWAGRGAICSCPGCR